MRLRSGLCGADPAGGAYGTPPDPLAGNGGGDPGKGEGKGEEGGAGTGYAPNENPGYGLADHYPDASLCCHFCYFLRSVFKTTKSPFVVRKHIKHVVCYIIIIIIIIIITDLYSAFRSEDTEALERYRGAFHLLITI